MWEMVNTGDSNTSVYRLAVPGGWIYKIGDCVVFVPDTAARDAALMAAFGKRSDDTNH